MLTNLEQETISFAIDFFKHLQETEKQQLKKELAQMFVDRKCSANMESVEPVLAN